MKKTGLLGLAAVAALGLGMGGANAVEVTGDIGGASVDSKNAYKLASELDFDELAADTVEISVGPTTAFISGNSLLTISMTNATFNTAVKAADIDTSDCTTDPNFTLSSGGAKGESSVTFLAQDLNGCALTDILTLPAKVDVTGAGDVTVTVLNETELGTKIDGGSKAVKFVALTDAVSTKFEAGTDAQAKVKADYLAFNDAGTDFDAVLGSVQVVIAAGVNKDLAGNDVAASDIEAVTVTLSGKLGAMIAGDVTVGSDSGKGDITASGVEIVAATPSAFATKQDVTVVVDEDTPIEASDFSATIEYTLDSKIFASQSAAEDDLASITRDGTSSILPWTASATTAAGSGSTTFVRISNPTADDFGKVSVRVLSSTESDSVGATATLADEVEAGSELVLDSQAIETKLGQDFGRADLEVTVEGTGAYVTRLVQRPDGVYEINNR